MKTHSDTLFPLPKNVTEITCVQNGMSKSKVMHDAQLIMKRGKNLGKALNNVMVRQHEALTCRSRDAHMSFVSPMPMEYQFSCSGSPPHALSRVSKRKFSSTTHTRRRVNITGRASLLNNAEQKQEHHVDEAAEEFIERFYRELRLQKWLEHNC